MTGGVHGSIKRIDVYIIKTELPQNQGASKGKGNRCVSRRDDRCDYDLTESESQLQDEASQRCRFIGAAPPSISQGEMAGQKTARTCNQAGGKSISDGNAACFAFA